MENNEREAKLIVDNGRWAEIDAWTNSHHPVSCSKSDFLFGLDLPMYEGAVRELSGERSTRMVSIVLRTPCPDEKNIYCLHVDDLLLQKIEDRWLIFSWGEVDEHYASLNCSFRKDSGG